METQQNADGGELKIFIIVGTVLVIGLLIIGYLGSNAANKLHYDRKDMPKTIPAFVKDPVKAGIHADELARKSKGDISKLSAEDARWLNSITAGNAEEFLKKRAKYFAEQDKKKTNKPKQK